MSSTIVILEIFWFCLGGAIFAYRPSRRVSEALSLGIVIALILFSLIFQVSFLLGYPGFSFVLEVLVAFSIFILLKKRYRDFRYIFARIKKFILDHKILSTVIIICWIYLFLLAVIIPPLNHDSMTYNLSRVFLFQQENSLFLKSVNDLRQALLVIGSDILPHAFLRFDSDYGVGIFSFLAYVSIGFGTYALSRNFASVKISTVSTLIIISLPEFCFQATSTKNDILAAASAVFCFITASRILEKLNIEDLSLTILGLAFGFSAKTTFGAFLVPFTLAFGLLVIKKFSRSQIINIVRNDWLYFIILTAPILVISQWWLFIHNAYYYNDLTGNTNLSLVQDDAIKGGISNLVKYFFQSIHLFPFDNMIEKIFGIDIGKYLVQVYEFLFGSFFGDATNSASGYPFVISARRTEDLSWFGPLGFLIIIPAIFFSLYKGNNFLRATSITLIGFILIVSYKLSWSPHNNRYVSLYFVASGAPVAFLLKKISEQVSRRLIKVIAIASLFILICSCALNEKKLLLGGYRKSTIISNSIWMRTNFGTDRLYAARRYYDYGDDLVDRFGELVPAGAKVAFVAGKQTWTYHFHLITPQIRLETTDFSEFKENAALYDYLFCMDIVDVDCNLSEINVPYNVLLNRPKPKEAVNSDSPPAILLLKILREK